jgi:hypothetical protein
VGDTSAILNSFLQIVQEDAEARARAAAAQQQALAAAAATHKQALDAELASLRTASASHLALALAAKDAIIVDLESSVKAQADAHGRDAADLAKALAEGQQLRRQLDALAETSQRDRQQAQAEHSAAVRLMKDDHAAALAAAARQLEARVSQ